MPRDCAQCGMYLDRYSFSDNQWRKGNGLSRCVDCVCDGPGWACDECAKTFPDENALRMHKRTHQARDFPCPGCNKLYRGLTDTAMHFESGNCSSCRGVENARRAAYQLCMQQPGGANFLTNPLMITDGGGAGGGYMDEGPNYKCNHCHKQFKFLSSLMQHQQTSACLHASSQQINLRIGNGPAVQEFKFFHGTTWTKACQIRDNGFIPSSGGCLGFGIYVAREEKATRFALLRAEETGQHGGLVELLVTVRNPKFVLSNDSCWQDEGYDACRAERTSASTNMEWCIRDPSQIEVVRITPVS